MHLEPATCERPCKNDLPSALGDVNKAAAARLPARKLRDIDIAALIHLQAMRTTKRSGIRTGYALCKAISIH